jgi:hypothetical protein
MSWGRPQAEWLPDGVRMHLHHGPIDLILWADPAARNAAYARAWARFRTILDELVTELPVLRSAAPVRVNGAVARRMAGAVAPYAPIFVTPMAAVAGAVADEVIAAMTAGHDVAKAWVNNGGDIGVHLSPGTSFSAAMDGGRISIGHGDGIGGIATSGWRGRSQSLGIADAVTVLAGTAAEADAAATLIANAVDLPGSTLITRRPARALKADSDLGDLPVTVDVGMLTPRERMLALSAGVKRAEAFLARGLIRAAHLTLQGEQRAVGTPLPSPQSEPLDA